MRKVLCIAAIILATLGCDVARVLPHTDYHERDKVVLITPPARYDERAWGRITLDTDGGMER